MIINSLLDTDAYKFFMQYVVFKKFPDVEVEYTFKNRTKGETLLYDTYNERLDEQIKGLCKLRFKRKELEFLKNLGWFSKGYLEFLKTFRLDAENIFITKGDAGELQIKIKGTWLNTILFEVPLLAIVSELHSYVTEERDRVGHSLHWENGKRNLDKKIEILHLHNTLQYADFGTRRRFTREWQEYVVEKLASKKPFTGFVGTSNVYLAMKYNVKPIGTMAHEYIQAMQAMVRLKDSQKFAFQTWADVYRGDLGIALSDTLGMNAFLDDFDMYFSKLFDGARHDSGNPYMWCDRLIKHYEAMNIDTDSKTAVFSDGLDVKKMVGLHKTFNHRINVSFGIGTNLTNDVGITPLQIVIKMVKCNGQNVCKVSDSPGKQMCEDDKYIKYVKEVFKIGDKLNER